MSRTERVLACTLLAVVSFCLGGLFQSISDRPCGARAAVVAP